MFHLAETMGSELRMSRTVGRVVSGRSIREILRVELES